MSADFGEKVELAVAFRAAEPSASVRAFIDAAIALGRRRELDASIPAMGSNSKGTPSTSAIGARR
jgi:hypothetical protein